MPLINCPKCGQSVSDSAKTCPHCGAVIKEEPKNFYALPYEKQDELKRSYISFGGIVPKEYEELRAKHIGRINCFIWLLCVFGVCSLILFLSLAIGVGITLFYIFAAAFVCIIGVLIFIIIRTVKKYHLYLQEMTTNRINFEKWLKDTNNIKVSWEWGSSTQSYSDYKKLKKEKGLE